MGKTQIGIAFYLPEEWEALRAIAPDPDVLEDTYEEWLGVNQEGVATLRMQGMHLKRVDVHVRDLAQWCQKQGRRPDGAARSAYVADALRRLSLEGFSFPDA